MFRIKRVVNGEGGVGEGGAVCAVWEFKFTEDITQVKFIFGDTAVPCQMWTVTLGKCVCGSVHYTNRLEYIMNNLVIHQSSQLQKRDNRL